MVILVVAMSLLVSDVGMSGMPTYRKNRLGRHSLALLRQVPRHVYDGGFSFAISVSVKQRGPTAYSILSSERTNGRSKRRHAGREDTCMCDHSPHLEAGHLHVRYE